MAVNGKAKAKAPKPAAANGGGRDDARSQEPPRPPAELAGEIRTIRLSTILTNSAINPREDFDHSKLAELAASIRRHGLLEPLVVREAGEQFELVAGERRLRACRLADLDAVPCTVRHMTDAEACEIALVENLDRQDLNPLEEAIGFQRLIDVHRWTQQRLADRLDCSQPHIANRLRLLELPEAWRRRVISGEITATHGRSLLAYRERANVLEAVAKALKEYREVPGAAEFDALLVDVVRDLSEAVDRGHYIENVGYVQPPKWTEAQLAELDVVEIKVDGRKERRAFNVGAFEKYLRAKGEKERARRDGLATTGGGKKSKPAAPTKAQQARRAKELAQQYARRLYAWKIDWLRYLGFVALGERPKNDAAKMAPTRLLMTLACERFRFASETQAWNTFARRGEVLYGALKQAGVEFRRATDAWRSLASIEAGQVPAAALAFCRGVLWNGRDKRPETILPADLVEELADVLALDLKGAWAAEQAGPLTEIYWSLHTKEQLVELGRELGVRVDETKPKPVIVAAFLLQADPKSRTKTLKLPQEILRAKPAR